MNQRTLEKICAHLYAGQSVNHKWSDTDALVIEKQLPYLCLYRYGGEIDADFAEIVRTQPAYLIVNRETKVKPLLHALAETVSSIMNAFMLLEVWPGHANSRTFRIYCPRGKAPATLHSLEKSLAAIHDPGEEARINVIGDEIGSPPGLDPIAGSLEESIRIGYLPVGLEVPPLYRKIVADLPRGIYFRGIKSLLSDAIKKAAFEFMRVQTPSKFNASLMLGKTEISDKALEIDRHLSDLSKRIDFLLNVSPVNTAKQWADFEKSGYRAIPNFSYRLITLDPEVEKRKLYSLPMSEVTDPALSFLLREKRLELDKQLNMLEERGTDSFKYLSESIYGVPSKQLVKQAKKILTDVEPRRTDPSPKVDCHGFSDLAQKEVDYLNTHFEDLDLSIEIRKDISSLMVSGNRLLIGEQVKISRKRAEALIQHEVGTHMLTFCNGKNQPLSQMASGLAGYDGLQEGLAVLAEYLVGGLNAARLRTLAARVMAVDALVKGNDFISVYRQLVKRYQLKKRVSFYITTRVFRGGGFTKDAVYLSGLLDVVAYLKKGGDLNLLFVGKFAFRHIPLVEELLRRNILTPPLLPTYFETEDFQHRLNQLKLDLSLNDLLNQ